MVESSRTQDWEWVAADVRAAAADFVSQLRSIGDMTIKVPNLDWSVGELAAHLISLPKLYHDQNDLDSFVRPTDFGVFSRKARTRITTRDPDELSELLIAQTAALLAECGEDPAAERTLYGQSTNGLNIAAGMLSELKLHAMDLAELSGAEVELTRRQALVALHQMMLLAPAFIDQQKARSFDGTYHLKFRGGADYTHVIADGVVTVTAQKPPKADAHLNADPVSFLLLSLGRMSQVNAALLAKVIVYGRKPWKIARLNSLLIDGV